MELILLRHGESLSVARPFEDCPPDWLNQLTDRGRDQAMNAVSKVISIGQPTRIITSPVRRALETAEVVSTAFGTQPDVSAHLSEIFSVARFTSQDDNHRSVLDFWTQFYSLSDQNRSALPAVADTLSFINGTLLKLHEDEIVLLVSHGGRLELLIALLLNASGLDRSLLAFRLECGNLHHLSLRFREGKLIFTLVAALNS